MITKQDIEEIWSKLGLVGFQIAETKRYADLASITEAGEVLSADEEHLLTTIHAQMKVAADATNVCAGFVRDWLRDHGRELPSIQVDELRPTTNLKREDQ